MTRIRLITLLLTLALALAMAPAVMAQDESPPAEQDTTSEDMSSESEAADIEEWDEDEWFVFYQAVEGRLLAMGVAEADIPAAMAEVGNRLAGMSEEDLEDLAELMAAQRMGDELSTEEEGEEVDIGDDEFMQDDAEEPDIDIDIGDDEDEEED